MYLFISYLCSFIYLFIYSFTCIIFHEFFYQISVRLGSDSNELAFGNVYWKNPNDDRYLSPHFLHADRILIRFSGKDLLQKIQNFMKKSIENFLRKNKILLKLKLKLKNKERVEKSFPFRIFLLEIENVVGYVENKESLNIMNFQYALGRVPKVEINETVQINNNSDNIKNKNTIKKNDNNNEILTNNINNNNNNNNNTNTIDNTDKDNAINNNKNDDGKNDDKNDVYNTDAEIKNNSDEEKIQIQESSDKEVSTTSFFSSSASYFPSSTSFLDPFNLFAKDSVLDITQYLPSFSMTTDTATTSNDISFNNKFNVINLEEKARHGQGH